MNIPHDYYLKFVQGLVYNETLNFHCKGAYTINDVTRHYSTLHHIPPDELRKLTGNELELNVECSADLLEADLSIPSLAVSHCLIRNDSCSDFKENPVSFSKLKDLLAPLVRKQGSLDKRGYPSGGALYPVEVFCCNLNADHAWPDGTSVYHLLGRSKRLERHSINHVFDNMREVFHPESNIGKPSVALVYCIYLPKALLSTDFAGTGLRSWKLGLCTCW